MELVNAFQIMIDLARQNVIDQRDNFDASLEQQEAVDTVEDFVVNQLGDA